MHGWMASLTQWTWAWVNSGSWWWTGRPGVLRFMGLQRVGHDWATDLIWSDLSLNFCLAILWNTRWWEHDKKGPVISGAPQFSPGLPLSVTHRGLSYEFCSKSIKKLNWSVIFYILHACVPSEVEIHDVSLQKELRDKVIDKKWIYLERNIFHKQNVGHCRRQEISEYGKVSFYGLGNFPS